MRLIVLKVVSIDLEMDTPERVEAYLAGQPEPKQTDLRQLHARMLADFPECRLWFDDGTNEDGKVVSNPNIGYGRYTITYANGSSREFYRIGLSANTTGISVYVLASTTRPTWRAPMEPRSAQPASPAIASISNVSPSSMPRPFRRPSDTA